MNLSSLERNKWHFANRRSRFPLPYMYFLVPALPTPTLRAKASSCIQSHGTEKCRLVRSDERRTDWVILHHAERSRVSRPASEAPVPCESHADEADGDRTGFGCRCEGSVSEFLLRKVVLTVLVGLTYPFWPLRRMKVNGDTT